jgi:UDP-N-acetyl-D-mannosaminuronate dehydrogenase
MGFTPSDFDTVLGCDVVALMTDHQEYRDAVERLNRIGRKLVDGRNVVPTAEYKIGNVSRRD